MIDNIFRMTSNINHIYIFKTMKSFINLHDIKTYSRSNFSLSCFNPIAIKFYMFSKPYQNS